MTTINLFRAVLEQALGERDRFQAELAALRAALAQQAEPVEPVAWMFELARNFNLEGYGGWEKRITEYRPNTPEGSVRNVTPLYTATPKRKPLTEEEAAKACGASGNLGPLMQIVRAVERAHGIKE